MAKGATGSSLPAAGPDGLVRLHHPDASSCSYDGTGYTVDADGDIWVPQTAVDALLAHGFVTPPATRAKE